MSNIQEDELHKVVIAHLLKYGNDFAENVLGKDIKEDLEKEADAIMAVLRQYAAKAQEDILERAEIKTINDLHRPLNVPTKQPWSEQAVLGMIDIFNERIKQLKEGM